MEPTEVGALLVGISAFVFLGLAYPPFLLLTAAVGVVFLVLGYRQDRSRTTESESGRDLVKCPACQGLETPDRSNCRYCGEPLEETATPAST